MSDSGPRFSALSWYKHEHGFWFRVYGYGLCVQSRKDYRPLFSERNGYRKALYVFGLRFEVLKP